MDSAVETFVEFLRQKNVPERIVCIARDEKLTAGVMKYMCERDLVEIFSSLGDRLHFRPIIDTLKVSCVVLVINLLAASLSADKFLWLSLYLLRVVKVPLELLFKLWYT